MLLPKNDDDRWADLDPAAGDELHVGDRYAIHGSDWDHCDDCGRNVVQVRFVVTSACETRTRILLRDRRIEGVSAIAYDSSDDLDEQEVESVQLCHGCVIARYGGEYLDRLGVDEWTDTPANDQEPNGNDPDHDAWRSRHAERRDAARQRRLAYLLRDVDMFEDLERRDRDA